MLYSPHQTAIREGVSPMSLEGKVALMSGGARGQGATEARRFAREGAKSRVPRGCGSCGEAAPTCP